MTAAILAPIKVNLALHVGPPRADGYHPVDTLCVFPEIGDILSYGEGMEPGIDYAGPFGTELADLPLSQNLVWRAFSILGIEPQGRFLLTKMVPVASGVGAGTADGAAAMLLLNDVLGLGLSADALIRLSIGLGADGPVCMAGQVFGGGLWRARGIGERVEQVCRIAPQAITIANPGLAVPTGGVFRMFDAQGPKGLRPVSAARGRSLVDHLRLNGNDLERPAFEMVPPVASLVASLAAQPGAMAARMSGSGASCYALHAGPGSAERAARALRSRGIWAEACRLLPG